MDRKKIFGLIIFCIFLTATVLPIFAQEKPDDKDWEKGRITAIGKDFIKVDGVRYNVSPDVVITGINDESLVSDMQYLRTVDEIEFKLKKDIIIEIRVMRLTS